MKRFLSVLCLCSLLAVLAAGCTAAPSSSVSPAAESSSALFAKLESYAPESYQDGGIFTPYYSMAYKKLEGMTTEEKVGQLFWARCPAENAAEEIAAYQFGGLVLFGRDFENLRASEVREILQSYQQASPIPLLLAVDEEGGTVCRISAQPLLRSEGRFAAPGDLFAEGGLDAVLNDTMEKDALLVSLGCNVNLAPVADIAQNPEDFMYPRSLRQDASTTAAVIEAVTVRMLHDGVQPTLKHFPGYGSNLDTHTGIAVDERPLSQFQAEDFLPFQAGIEVGAPCVMVSHNIVNCMDDTLPASLSPEVHRILREDLYFTGVITSDELDMGAIKEFTNGENPCVQALLAGNDMLMVTDYQNGYAAVLAAVEDGTIPEDTLNRAVFRILSWKMSMGLL